jgi:hypothetical protein
MWKSRGRKKIYEHRSRMEMWRGKGKEWEIRKGNKRVNMAKVHIYMDANVKMKPLTLYN